MKIMTYNILTGGAAASPDSRIDQILSVITDAKPDVLALQEANNFDSNGMMEKFAETLGLPYSFLAQGAVYEDGDRYNGAIFSRYPIGEVWTFPKTELQNAALSTLIETPLGPVSFCGIHLHAFSEDKRLPELKSILAHQSQFESQVLLGDFNAMCRGDTCNGAESEVEARYDVMDRMQDVYVDAIRAAGREPIRSFPTGIAADHSFEGPRRIDHIFVTPNLAERIVDAEVIHAGAAQTASDHFPVVAALRD